MAFLTHFLQIGGYVLFGCRVNLGMDLTRTTDSGNNDALFKDFWQHNDAIVCCTWKVLFLFFNICAFCLLQRNVLQLGSGLSELKRVECTLSEFLFFVFSFLNF